MLKRGAGAAPFRDRERSRGGPRLTSHEGRRASPSGHADTPSWRARQLDRMRSPRIVRQTIDGAKIASVRLSTWICSRSRSAVPSAVRSRLSRSARSCSQAGTASKIYSGQPCAGAAIVSSRKIGQPASDIRSARSSELAIRRRPLCMGRLGPLRMGVVAASNTSRSLIR